jgi:hypothetical protein
MAAYNMDFTMVTKAAEATRGFMRLASSFKVMWCQSAGLKPLKAGRLDGAFEYGANLG